MNAGKTGERTAFPMKHLKSAIVAAATATALALAPVATAVPQPAGVVKTWDAPSSPPLVTNTGTSQGWVKQVDHKNLLSFKVFSPSMKRDIPVAVIPATDAAGKRVQKAPTLYLLNGAGGAEQDQDWVNMATTVKFFQGKRVNVVIPQAGAFSYYTDWVDNNLNTPYLKGPQKWETFLTKELPGPIERTMNANDKRAIAGFSMSGTSALVLPQHNPGMYKAAASFSGCAATSSPHAYNYARLTVNRGGAQPEQMWGPMGGKYNRYNDALLGAEKLRGTKLYISTATGLAGRQDQVSYLVGLGLQPAAAQLNSAILQVEGGVIEAAINQCTHDLRAKLEGLKIPAHYEFRNVGTHSWSYWRTDVEKAWATTLKPALGV